MIKLFENMEEAVKKLPLSILKDFKHGGKSYAITRLSSGIRVFENSCPHDGASLSWGEVRGETVACPWHHYHFSLNTGECTDYECGAMKLFEVVENQEGVFVNV